MVLRTGGHVAFRTSRAPSSCVLLYSARLQSLSRAIVIGVCAGVCGWSSDGFGAPVPVPGRDPAPASTEGAPPAVAPPAAEEEKTAWVPGVKLNGGIAIYYYQPTNGWENQFLIYSNLRFQARWDAFGLYFEPRLSNEKMRAFYDGLAWVHQAYVFAEFAPVTLKIGKLYKQVGLFWDNTFYGNIQVYEGLKFDPNSGVSLEAKFGKSSAPSCGRSFSSSTVTPTPRSSVVTRFRFPGRAAATSSRRACSHFSSSPRGRASRSAYPGSRSPRIFRTRPTPSSAPRWI